MSSNDSFIDEVSEAVQRDRLFGMMKRYGWIAVLIVVAIVGASAWSEWQKAQTTARSQAAGDALLDALDPNETGARVAALGALTIEGPAVAVSALLTAAEMQAAGDTEGARAILNDLAVNGEVPVEYRDLAALKALMLPGGDLSEADRRIALDALARPGNPYRLLAVEQLALLDVAAGDTGSALARLRAITDDAETTQGLRERAQGLIVALGGELAADPAAN